jgi:hypothetical protein
MNRSPRLCTLTLFALVFASTGCSGGGGDGGTAEEAIECCMLRQLASECSNPSANPSSSLLQATQDWREVGNSGNDDACTRMVDDSTLGCTSSTFTYGEGDALVDCS